jgi:quercetin dioxygenase-like cupin family protein
MEQRKIGSEVMGSTVDLNYLLPYYRYLNIINKPMKVVSKHNPLEHYQWGENCDGWRLLKEETLSVIQERMPSGTSEAKHYHHHAQQFFYILKGKADFEIEDQVIELNAGEGLHIEAGRKHRIINGTNEDLEFILCSQPSTANDRLNC